MACFGWLARETAQNLNYDLPPVAEDEIAAWVRSCYENWNQEQA
jgi:hypothetical protein